MERRSKSLPPKAIHKIPKRCYFYHAKGKCQWGQFCRYQHRISYVPKLIPAGNLPACSPPKTPQQIQDRVKQIREQIRKHELQDYMANIRNQLLSQVAIEALPTHRPAAPPMAPNPEKKQEDVRREMLVDIERHLWSIDGTHTTSEMLTISQLPTMQIRQIWTSFNSPPDDPHSDSEEDYPDSEAIDQFLIEWLAPS